MAPYNGPRKPCYDCMKADATEYLGRRIKTATGRADLHVCKDCADYRLGKNLDQYKNLPEVPEVVEESPPPVPTRTASFTQGHDNVRMWQPELGQ